MTIKPKEIPSLCKIIVRKFPEAIIDYEEKNAEKNIETKFRNAMCFCPEILVFFEAGWQQIEGRKIYLRDGIHLYNGTEINTGLTLPALHYGPDMLWVIFQRAMGMYKDLACMAVMFTFSLMGVLYRPFKEAGYPPHFTLFMFGKTGSMKTTIAKILCTQLCNDDYRDSVRRIDSDTPVSLERAVVSAGCDTVTLIDDFSPAKTKSKKREMDDKLEMIIRMVGDGSSRSRSNIKLEDRRGEGVQGMVALTGELRGKGVSSNLRCFYCEMKREWADEETITWFQENPHLFTTLIAAFVDWIGGNYAAIVEQIRKNFSLERKVLSGILKEKRLIDSAVTLRLAADIFEWFLKSGYQVLTGDIITKMKAEIINCALVSQDISSEESPSIAFIQALAALLRMNKIALNAEKIRITEASEYDGFEDDDFLYFNPDIAHKKAVAFLKQTNRHFPYDLKEVLTMLADDGIIKTAPNGTGKRTYCVRIPVGNGAKQNFLKIRKTIFADICEGNYDCEKGERE